MGMAAVVKSLMIWSAVSTQYERSWQTDRPTSYDSRLQCALCIRIA